MSCLDRIAQLLDWSTQRATEFRHRYELLWGQNPQPECLRPQAPWIIETVAVLPDARGRGYGKILLRALLDKGRSLDLTHAGIMVINGNEIARHTYESLGFRPYVSFYADYFDAQFSGLTKFRIPLNPLSVANSTS